MTCPKGRLPEIEVGQAAPTTFEPVVCRRTLHCPRSRNSETFWGFPQGSSRTSRQEGEGFNRAGRKCSECVQVLNRINHQSRARRYKEDISRYPHITVSSPR